MNDHCRHSSILQKAAVTNTMLLFRESPVLGNPGLWNKKIMITESFSHYCQHKGFSFLQKSGIRWSENIPSTLLILFLPQPTSALLLLPFPTTRKRNSWCLMCLHMTIHNLNLCVRRVTCCIYWFPDHWYILVSRPLVTSGLQKQMIWGSGRHIRC